MGIFKYILKIVFFQSSTSVEVVNNNVEVMDKLIVAGYDVKVL